MQQEFKAIGLIANVFNAHKIKYQVIGNEEHREVIAAFPIDGGAMAIIRFICSERDQNDVAVRIFGVVTKTPVQKRSLVIQTCNQLNKKVRYLKFYIDDDGDVNADFDFPICLSDEDIGNVALEILQRSMMILDNEYSAFMKAIYSDVEREELAANTNCDTDTLLKLLEEVMETGDDELEAVDTIDVET